MKKIIVLFGLTLTVALFIYSCNSSTYDEISVPVTNPTYEANIAPTIKANCTGCHSNNGQYPKLTDYSSVKDAAQNGNLICRIDKSQACGQIMPPSGSLSGIMIERIKLWKEQGYIQN